MPALRNPRHEQFCLGIVANKSVIDAFIGAGYKGDGTNDGNAYRLRQRPDVVARIAELQGAAAAEVVIDKARWLRELAKIGFSDIRQMFDADGGLLAVDAIDEDTAGAVSSIKVVTKRLPGGDGEAVEVEHVAEIKLWDKLSALDKIGKHHGWVSDKLALSNPDGSPLAAPQSDIELARMIAFLLTKAGKATD